MMREGRGAGVFGQSVGKGSVFPTQICNRFQPEIFATLAYVYEIKSEDRSEKHVFS